MRGLKTYTHFAYDMKRSSFAIIANGVALLCISNYRAVVRRTVVV